MVSTSDRCYSRVVGSILLLFLPTTPKSFQFISSFTCCQATTVPLTHIPFSYSIKNCYLPLTADSAISVEIASEKKIIIVNYIIVKSAI